MSTFLLDSNILIYLLAQNERVDEFINDLCAHEFAMSSISYLEILVEAEKSGMNHKEVEAFLEEVDVVAFDKKAVQRAIRLQKSNTKKLKFKDLSIAATSLIHKMPLVTADKDFKSIEGLEVKYVKI
jgi:predicted nucleic acid-binding protein